MHRIVSDRFYFPVESFGAAVTAINLSDVDFVKKKITVEEKGGIRHTYQINKEGLAAIRVTQRRHIGKALHPTSHSLDNPLITHGIDSPGRDSRLDCLSGAKDTCWRVKHSLGPFYCLCALLFTD